MSPPGRGVLEARIAVVDRDATIEALTELNSGTGKAEAFRLGRDLKSLPVPLHDVVVANDAFVDKAANAIQFRRSGMPGLGLIPRRASETPIVIGEEAAQDPIGGIQIAGTGQAQFAREAILERAPEPLDAALGLWTVGGNVGDAELFEGAAELSGLAFSGELFLDRPVIVIAGEDAMAIAVEGERHTVAAQQAAEQAKIAASVFGESKERHQDLASRIVEKGEQSQLWAPSFEPVVEAGIEQHHFPFPSAAETALTVSGGTPLSGRAEASGAEQPTQRLAAEGQAFLLDELFAEVVIIEPGVTGPSQMQDPVSDALRQAARAGPPAAGVCQSRCACLPITRFESFHMPRSNRE
jgi:hypothetical protein